MQEVIIHAVLLAFGLILPLGAQNLFIFNQGATQSRWIYALPSVITAAICDTILIVLSIGGLSVILAGQEGLTDIIYIGGCVFLLYMAWTLWRSDSRQGTERRALSPRRQILFAVSVSVLNPHAIIDILGVIGTNSLEYEGTERITFTIVTIIVSWLWFILLSAAGRLMGRWDESGKISFYMNKASSMTMALLALYMLYKIV
ncbi:lysine transporter LysE [Paenibacillus sp. FSL H7-0326]|uniref:LysE/ArgO family amino acid transporter n=1 Tax=Paenibacillus sp. FSL H7-0326 TaxID=1921144 RepID=UPI00096C7B42|nr:LysE/ArgO family amino acid transporter [Paenibacillus sp. FSL H7-0326]OMC66609.1 lysine transporter LysE [Paenibacillus sp. FSL H7-0326]